MSEARVNIKVNVVNDSEVIEKLRGLNQAFENIFDPDIKNKTDQFVSLFKHSADSIVRIAKESVDDRIKEEERGKNKLLQITTELSKARIEEEEKFKKEAIEASHDIVKNADESAKKIAHSYQSAFQESSGHFGKITQVHQSQVSHSIQLANHEVEQRNGILSKLKMPKFNVEGLSEKLSGGLQKTSGLFKTLSSVGGETGAAMEGIAGSLGTISAAGGPATMAVAATVEILQASIDIGSKFEDAQASFQAATGVSDEKLSKLSDHARDLSKSMGVDATEGMGVFQSLASDLGSEVTKDTDALAHMGKDVLTLSKGLGIDAATATSTLTSTFKSFGDSTASPAAQAKEFDRIMNVMAASTQQGALKLPELTDALQTVGKDAKESGLSLEQTVGAIQTLNKGGVKGDVGAGLSSFLQSLNTNSKDVSGQLKKVGMSMDDINPKKVGFTQALKNIQEAENKLGSEADKTAFRQKLFGDANEEVRKTLMGNLPELDKMTKGVTGTSTASQQADTQGKTFNGQLNILLQNFKDIGLIIFEKIKPALEEVLMPLLNALMPIIGTLIKVGLTLFKDVTLQIVKAVMDLAGVLWDLATRVWGKLSDYWDSFKVLINGVIGVVKNFIGEILTVIKEIGNWINSFLPLEAIINKVIGWVGGLIDQVKSVTGAIGGILGLGGDDKPKAPSGGNQSGSSPRKFARGAVLTKPIFSPLLEDGAIAGEAGPEAIIPLDQMPFLVGQSLLHVIKESEQNVETPSSSTSDQLSVASVEPVTSAISEVVDTSVKEAKRGLDEEKKINEEKKQDYSETEQAILGFVEANGEERIQKLESYASKELLGIDLSGKNKLEAIKKWLLQQLISLAASKWAEAGVVASTEAAKTGAAQTGFLARAAIFAGDIGKSLASAAASAFNAAVSVVEWISKIIPFPFSLAVIPAGIASIYGLYQGAKKLFKFKDGGITQNAQMFSFGAGGEHTGVFGENPSSKGEAFIPLEKLPDVVGRMVVTPQGKLDMEPLVQQVSALTSTVAQLKEHTSAPVVVMDQYNNILSQSQAKQVADSRVLG